MEILIAILIAILLYILVIYNKLVSSRQKVKQSMSGIDVYLNQRFDLIPNLVECVKGYVKYEEELIKNITKMRTDYINQKENNINQGVELNNECNKLLAVAENYPDLKASQQFMNLQKNLTKMESQLQAARRIYNYDVTTYNTKLNVMPNNLIAKLFGFKEEKLLEIDPQMKDNINVKYDEK